jgi:hypothetical protein
VFEHPSFLMHFIPIFYGMYQRNADLFLQNDMDHMDLWWQQHFYPQAEISADMIIKMNAILDTYGSFLDDKLKDSLRQMAIATDVMLAGVRAHILNDMPIALQRAYTEYSQRYQALDFDGYRRDFFELNRPVFQKVSDAIISDMLSDQFLAVTPQQAQAGAEFLHMGLSVDEVFQWRDRAWRIARDALANANGNP